MYRETNYAIYPEDTDLSDWYVIYLLNNWDLIEK